MKIVISKIILSDRYLQAILAAVLLIIIFSFIALISFNNLEKENKNLNQQLQYMEQQKKEIIHIKSIVESQEKKIGLTKTNSVVSALEQILKSLGLQAKVIKPLAKKKNKLFIEEDSELQIENIDLNIIVNLLYKIENSPVPLKIKNAVIKTEFENPNMFILGLTVSFISK